MYLPAILLSAVSPHLNSKFWTAVLAFTMSMWTETWITGTFANPVFSRNLKADFWNLCPDFSFQLFWHPLSHLCGQFQLWHVPSQLTHQSVSFRVCLILPGSVIQLASIFLLWILEMHFWWCVVNFPCLGLYSVRWAKGRSEECGFSPSDVHQGCPKSQTVLSCKVLPQEGTISP